ncbi:hypothetical protein D3C72_2270040 [compost metagenome]
MSLYAIGASSILPPIKVTSLAFKTFLISLCVKVLLHLALENKRPAPCEAEFKLSAFPFPFTIKPGAVIEPGIIPNCPSPAGVAPFLCTIHS